MKRILIFGGSGFLGRNIIKFYSDFQETEIFSVSRSETRIVEAQLAIPNNRASFIVADISDAQAVNDIIQRVSPDYVVVASAMKHIFLCEKNPEQTVKVNVQGTLNVINAVDRLRANGTSCNLCFVSTDKACDPINTYGFSKALAERNVLGRAHAYIKNRGYNTVVRYGNVLNSPMSIIPIIHDIIRKGGKTLYLTSEEMTRFIMTVEQSVQLIHYSLTQQHLTPHYNVLVPKLPSMYVKDLLEIFAEEYGCEINVIGASQTEKFGEKMIGDSEECNPVGFLSPITSEYKDTPLYVTGPFVNEVTSQETRNLFQSNNKNLIVSKDALKNILQELNLLNVK